jgi:hypothetical protein
MAIPCRIAMPDYLLSCTCGQKLTVSSRQAGESLRCSCGTMLEVPTMRGLRELEAVQPAGTPRAGSWGGRQQAVLLLVACAIGLCGIAGYLAWTRPPDPTPAPPPVVEANVPLQTAMDVAADFSKGPGGEAAVLSLEARRLAKQRELMTWGIRFALALAASAAAVAAVVLVSPGGQKR